AKMERADTKAAERVPEKKAGAVRTGARGPPGAPRRERPAGLTAPVRARTRRPFRPMAVSPLAPQHVPAMPAIAGVRLAPAQAGIRYRGRTDVLLAVLDKGTTVAGVFTRSKCPSAPVEWCRAQLGRGAARALVVNSGNANAFTGKHGREATKLTADVAAKAVGCRPGEVFLASTG